MTRVKTLVLFLILEEMFQFFTIENNVCSRFVVCGLYYVEVVLENALAPHSSTLAWKIPRTEEPGRLQSMGSLGVGHD